MNAAHLHLIVNHLPAVLSAVAVILILAGLRRPRPDLRYAGYFLGIAAAIAAFLAYRSGQGAAHALRGLPGLRRGVVHAHAEAAEKSAVAAWIFGGLCLLACFRAKLPAALARFADGLALLAGLVTVAMLLWTAELGGHIRHPEAARDWAGWKAESAGAAISGAPRPGDAGGGEAGE